MPIPAPRALRLVACSLATLQILACSGTENIGPSTPARVASVTISIPRTSFRVGESIQAGALPLDSVGAALTGRNVIWASETPEIVSVSSGGLVTGLNPGVATISATVEEKRATLNLQVSLVPVSTIAIEPATQTVSAGGSIVLSVVLKDSAQRILTGRAITWRSANTSTADVNEAGVVTGKIVGTTDIFASTEGKEAKATVTVNTLNTPVATVTITGANNSMSGGARKQLTPTLRDANGNILGGRTITWTTSAANRATVSQTGEVTALPVDAPVTITATSEGRSGTFNIEIITFTRLTSGNGFACGLTGDGTGYCWGIIGGTLPTKVATEVKFAAISAGNGHVCALGVTGGSYCWGINTYGQLGTGNVTTVSTPTQVLGGQQFISIAAGQTSTCATTASLDVFCWGQVIRPPSGQPYDEGNRISVTSPEKVGTGIVAVVGGGIGPQYPWGIPDRYCGVNSAGSAYCWYRLRSNQQVADGPTTQLSPLHFSTLRMGPKHICGIELSKLTFCVGDNDQGQLGDGTTINRSTMTQIAGGHEFQALAAGTNHTCGMTSAGTTYCWGSNSDGQLGIGTTGGSRSTPTLVSGSIAFTGIRGGNLITCGLAAGGAAYCWGYNQNRQLGDGTTAPSNAPRQVFGN